MGKMTESFLPTKHLEDSAQLSTSLMPNNSLFNFMETFEEDHATVEPDVCRLHIPTWLNLWCVFISICVLMLLVVLGVLVRYIQLQKQRIIRSEIVHGK